MTAYRSDRYRDSGCQEAGVSSCLDCPLPRCVEEMTAAERAALAARHREKWDVERVRVIREEGLSVEDAAERFSISPRTVWRILARTRKAGSRREDNSG